MGKEKIEALIEGGKATAAPPLGPALGPMGVNIGQVISEINKKTESFKGMKVPITVIIDTDTKDFEIEVGTPPTSQLIKKELNLQKGASYPNIQKIANMSIEQVIKVAKMKLDSLHVPSLKSAVKTIIGSANSLGVLVEGKNAKEINADIDSGKFDKEIEAEATETPEEKKAILKEQLEAVQKKYAKELEKRKVSAAPKEDNKEKKK
ncbi:50S ribosomal protein L11 [Candidatus Woesearchaeota archaeon]|nr:MAG: 50S ribosomal protein L11 [Candidatus Woesearchaeota archaeon]